MKRLVGVLFPLVSLVGFGLSVPVTGLYRWQLVVLIAIGLGTTLLVRASESEAAWYLGLALLWVAGPVWSVPLWWPWVETLDAPGVRTDLLAITVGVCAPLVLAAAGFVGFCMTFPERLVLDGGQGEEPDVDRARRMGWFLQFEWGGLDDAVGRRIMEFLSQHPERVWSMGVGVWVVAVAPIWALSVFDLRGSGWETGVVAWSFPLLFFVALVAVTAPVVAMKSAAPEARPRWLWFLEGLNLAFLLLMFGSVVQWIPLAYTLLSGQLFAESWFDAIGAWSSFLVPCAVLAGIAMAVFYDGALDPKLAIKRTTLYGAMASFAVVLFAVVETLASDLMAARLGLPGSSGSIVAGASVAFAFQAGNKRLKDRVWQWVDERLPDTTLADTARYSTTVLFSDIIGYTALTAESEDDALTLMSVFHRQARRAAEQNKGRLVKTIGDEVLLEFKEPQQAIAAAQQLTTSFTDACAPLGLPPAQLRTGIHMGEVAKRRDGDLFGDAVNIASRLQGVAEPDQIIVSQAVADQLDADLEDLGEKDLKNVPEPVRCYSVQG